MSFPIPCHFCGSKKEHDEGGYVKLRRVDGVERGWALCTPCCEVLLGLLEGIEDQHAFIRGRIARGSPP